MRADEIPSEKLERGSKKVKTYMYYYDKWKKPYLNPYNTHILNYLTSLFKKSQKSKEIMIRILSNCAVMIL